MDSTGYVADMDSSHPASDEQLSNHELAMRDVRILCEVGPEDDLDDLVEWSVQQLPREK